MKTPLFLLTDAFPYGLGEAYIQPELDCLCRDFHVTVIPRFPGTGQPRPLPAGATLLPVARPLRLREKLCYPLAFFLSRAGRRELSAILKGRERVLPRLRDSLRVYTSARLLFTELRERGVVARSRGAVFYAFWHSAAALALSLHRDRLPGAAAVARTNGYDLYNDRWPGRRQPFKPAADEGLDRVFFPSRMGKRYYLDAFDVKDDGKYLYMPLGSLHVGPVSPESGDGTLRLMSCSNALAMKRVSLIIQALALLDIPLEWTHIGAGPELSRLETQAASLLGGRSNVRWRFTGELDHESVHALYRSRPWDGFITTSSTEGLPVSVMEALSYSLPVIATAVGGIPEQLEGTDNILLSSDPTAAEVAAAILRLHDLPPAERAALRDGNIRRWQREYDARRNGRSTAAVLAELKGLDP